MVDPDRDADRDERTKPPDEPRPANWGLAFDLGLRLGISVILGLGGGLLLDSWLRTSPIFTLIGMVLGIGAAMYTIWDVARDSMRR
jgi:ATP synthase protein I